MKSSLVADLSRWLKPAALASSNENPNGKTLSIRVENGGEDYFVVIHLPGKTKAAVCERQVWRLKKNQQRRDGRKQLRRSVYVATPANDHEPIEANDIQRVRDQVRFVLTPETTTKSQRPFRRPADGQISIGSPASRRARKLAMAGMRPDK